MSNIVELKYWQLIVLCALALYGFLQLIILPLLQKLIYRRFQATERRLDEELGFGLPSYALANRRLWIDRLLNDPDVKSIMKTLASDSNAPPEQVHKNARKYADEIVPSFNAFLYFRFGSWISKIFLRLFYWIKVGYSAETDYDKISKNDCVVLVSNHRSNFDPFLLIYMASKRAPISYSAGRWALAFPFRQILHAIGFYIVRRDRSGDPLYHCLLKRYVFLATSQCVPQGLFLEGGLSRNGKMQPLQLGLLNYILSANQEGNCENIMFVPAALNYDRIPEFKTLLAHEDTGFDNKGRFYSVLSFLRFVATVSSYVLPRRHKPYGYACVNFGTPVSLSVWQEQNGVDLKTQDRAARRSSVDKLGEDLAQAISGLIPILPTHILARVLSTSKAKSFSEIDLKVKATALIKALTKQGTSVFLPKNDEDYALSQGISILLRERVIEQIESGRFALAFGHEQRLAYYSNTINDMH